VSTSTLGGHVNTIQDQSPVNGRRRRRLHSDEFKAIVVASCMQPGISMAAVAMANGVNANLLRRWVREAEMRRGGDLAVPLMAPKSLVKATPAAFVPMELPAKSAAPDIRIELRRGATSVTVTWPTDAAAECAAWMRELLR
jgi:transposase